MEEIKFYKNGRKTYCVPASMDIPDEYCEISFVDYLKDNKIKLPFNIKNLKLYLTLGQPCILEDCYGDIIILYPAKVSTIDFQKNKFKLLNISIRNRVFTRRDFRILAISYNDIDKL